MRILLLLFLFIGINAKVNYARTSNTGPNPEDAERKWLIAPIFGSATSKTTQLSSIFKDIILGKYSLAERNIRLLRTKYQKDLKLRSILMLYEANIKYNQSSFRESVAYCDSAIHVLDKSKNDLRIIHKAHNFKAKALGALSENKESLTILNKVVKSCSANNDRYNLGAAYYFIGTIYSDLGNYKTSSVYILKSIPLRREVNDQLGLAASYAFMGLCYAGLDRYGQAIDIIHRSIRIREKLNDKRGLANSYLSMYKVYYELGEINRALNSEYKSLKICSELKDLQCVSGRYTNLGQLHQKLGDYNKALYFHKKALILSKKLNIKNRIALVYENMARLYMVKNELKTAQVHLESSLLLRNDIGDEEGIISLNVLLAQLRLKEGQLINGKSTAAVALLKAQKLGIRSVERDAHQILSEIELNSKNFAEALYHFKKYTHLKDSLFSVDQSKQLVRQELKLNYDKKALRDKQIQDRIKEQARKESAEQRRMITQSAIALIVLSALLLFGLLQYRSKVQSQKKLELLNDELRNTNLELGESKQVIEVQHREITDSLNYAQQIQRAILPKTEDLRTIFPQSFVLYFPKEAIGGDFYWATQLENKKIIVVADGTGHGVPGGFLTMLGVSMLNELVIEQKITSPAELLNQMRSKVISSLKQSFNEGEHKDGFDMSICVIEEGNRLLTYAIANQSILLKKDKELLVLRGNRFPVGLYGEEMQTFDEFTFELEEGNYLYLMTDGFSDQFGGENGKKYKSKNLQNFIASLKSQNASEQSECLKTEFYNWKGSFVQTDDVTLFGIKVL